MTRFGGVREREFPVYTLVEEISSSISPSGRNEAIFLPSRVKASIAARDRVEGEGRARSLRARAPHARVAKPPHAADRGLHHGASPSLAEGGTLPSRSVTRPIAARCIPGFCGRARGFESGFAATEATCSHEGGGPSGVATRRDAGSCRKHKRLAAAVAGGGLDMRPLEKTVARDLSQRVRGVSTRWPPRVVLPRHSHRGAVPSRARDGSRAFVHWRASVAVAMDQRVRCAAF